MVEDGVIIDPGHGGTDPGASGNGIIEEHYTLATSMYMYNRFKQLGVPVKITRTTDKTLEPNERTKIIRNSGMKYCLSNHVNAGGGDGAEIIHSAFSAQGKKLGNEIAAELKKCGQNVRKVYSRKNSKGTDYYFIQRETGSVTSLIVEYGFLDSKADDVEQLKKDQFEFAEAVVKAFCEFIGVKYVAPAKEKEKETEKDSDLLKVQVGAFESKENAEKLKEELIKKGYKAYITK
ncbi:N-acetylmuramoyl-L-alanine amidase [Peribacillus asahii]|uniref:N-acetylmuramoyl-L-alanine amidase n=1 Tax=Peribacillus asahii TaxID=228899 RepID=UPI00207ACB96|nr:N-acetylmuramoyl-L-alanine amidase [Peribacillus asahii]USK72614.1 N-acetylmuramoyl-L-alanine amidase [Peribacillus asahii]USK72730.1 N-acetylmuramoyl-L-alanine amidase [Peribacillus asahii]